MTPGAWKTLCTEDKTLWCCTGTAFEEFSTLNDSIYYRDGEGISVNLFIASKLDDKDRSIGLRQETRFPDEPCTSLTITKAPTAAWTLRLRIPGWTANATVKVNGRVLEGTPSGGSYLSLARRWKPGDHVELELPMSLSAESFPDEPRVRAFLYGPVVLACDLGRQGLTEELIMDKQWPEVSRATAAAPPELRASGRKLEDWIKPDGAAPLTFRAAAAGGAVALRPLSRLWGRFAAYFNVED